VTALFGYELKWRAYVLQLVPVVGHGVRFYEDGEFFHSYDAA